MTNNSFALITGSSSGIGKALAEEFALRQINLLLVALPDSGLHEVMKDLTQKHSIKCFILEIDLTVPDAALRILEWCNASGYKIQYLINNAGFGNLCPFEKTDSQLIHNMMLLNNHAMVTLTHALIPLIRKNQSGYIMNVGSLASFLPIPNKSVYAATKSFVYAFTSALRLELSPYRIHVCCLCPGGTATSADTLQRMKAIGSTHLFQQTPKEVASEAVREMFERRGRIIPGWHNKVFFILSSVLPKSFVEFVLQRVFNKPSISQKRTSLIRELGSIPGMVALAHR